VIEQAGGGTFFVLLAIAASLLVAFFLFEAWALFFNYKPITGYVRDGVRAHPNWAALVALLAGLLGGHFWR
jgi:hypothetical protein